SERFDNVVIARKRGKAFKATRVQVRSAYKLTKPRPKWETRAYQFTLLRALKKRPYRAGDFDVLAAYVAPLDTWYIIPFDKLKGRQTLTIYPEKDGTRCPGLEEFRERWDLLE